MSYEKITEVRPEDIELDKDIYPRKRISQTTVDSYTEAMKGEANFPPPLVQKIKEDGKTRIISLDGWHTTLAHIENEEDMIQVEHWKNKVIDKNEHLEELRLVSSKKNMIHGDRLSEGDIEFQVRRIAEDRPHDELNGMIKELAEEFSVTKGRMSQLIGDILSRRKASRDDLIYRMEKQGLTQKKIGEIVGLSKSGVSRRLSKFKAKLSQHLELGLEEDKSIDKIAKEHGYNPLTPWIMYLEGKSDRERFRIYGGSHSDLDDEPQAYDLWRYGNYDKRLGIDYEGRTWGQICLNLLYYYSDQGDLVVDPMAGGGTMIDASLVMNRKCKAYDVKPARKDIFENDIREGYPEEAQNADLIFLDPPYYKRGEDLYDCQEISKDKSTFMGFIRNLAKDSFSTVDEKGSVALLFGDCKDYNGREDVFAPELYSLFVDEGFTIVDKIQAPESTQMFAGRQDEAREKKQILTLGRVLYIFRKK